MNTFAVSFPNLNLDLTISRSFNLFGLDIYWYGVVIGVAIALGVILISRRAKKHCIDQDTAIDVCLWGIVFAIIFARLYYVIFTPGMLDNGFLEIFNLRNGGLAIYGGIIGGGLAVAAVALIKKINFWRLLDLIVPYVALGQAIGRWGNFFNQEAFGTTTDSLFAMKSQMTTEKITSLISSPVSWIDTSLLDAAKGVHPTFLYESIGCLVIFFILLIVRNAKYKRGMIFALYGALYGLLRMVIEGLRTDSLMFMNDTLRVSQVFAAASAVVAIVAFIYLLYYGRAETNEMSAVATDGEVSDVDLMDEEIDTEETELSEDGEASEEPEEPEVTISSEEIKE